MERLRLTKTEMKILTALCAKGRFVATWASGRGAQGGHVQGGKREYEAAKSLVRMGIVNRVGAIDRDADTKKGRTLVYRTITVELKKEPQV